MVVKSSMQNPHETSPFVGQCGAVFLGYAVKCQVFQKVSLPGFGQRPTGFSYANRGVVQKQLALVWFLNAAECAFSLCFC